MRETRISPACGEAHDAGGEVDGESGDVVAGAFDFAGVQAGANVEPEVAGVG